MSLVRMIKDGEVVIRRNGNRTYIHKPLITKEETKDTNINAAFSNTLEKVIDLTKQSQPIPTKDNYIVDVINTIDNINDIDTSFATQLETTIQQTWSNTQ